MTLTSTPRRKPILVFDNALTFTALCANLLASLPYFIERDPTAVILYTSGALTMADPWAGATCCAWEPYFQITCCGTWQIHGRRKFIFDGARARFHAGVLGALASASGPVGFAMLVDIVPFEMREVGL